MENMRADIRASRIKLPGFFKGSIKCHIRNSHRNLFRSIYRSCDCINKISNAMIFFFFIMLTNLPSLSRLVLG